MAAGKVAVKGCDRAVTEMYSMIALLKPAGGQRLQSHCSVHWPHFHTSS